MGKEENGQLFQRLDQLERSVLNLTKLIQPSTLPLDNASSASNKEILGVELDEDTVRSSVDFSENVHRALKIYLAQHDEFKKIGPFIQYLVIEHLGSDFINSVNK